MQPGLHSSYQITQKVWNEANKAMRQAMLLAANHNKNDHYARAFNFLPQHIRNDLIIAQMRQSKPLPAKTQSTKPKTAAKPVRDYWFNNI